jgi:hypothetical protein
MFSFPRLQQTPDSRPLADVQRALGQLVAELNALPPLNGRLVEGVRLAGAVSKDVAHGLGRPLRGWIVVRLAFDALPAVVSEAPGNENEGIFLRLVSAEPVTLSLWVF